MRRMNRGRVALALGAAVALAATGALAVRAAAAPVTPTPAILSGPNAATTTRTASFSYRDTQASATFKCSLDAGSYTSGYGDLVAADADWKAVLVAANSSTLPAC